MCRIMRAVLFICLCAPCTGIWGQEMYDYSDDERSLAAFADSLRIQIRSNEGIRFEDLKDFNVASDKIKTQFAEGTKHLLHGIWYNRNSDNDLAFTEIRKAQSLLESCCYYSREHAHSLRYYGYILNNVGLLNFDTIVFKKVAVHMNKAAEIAEVVQDTFQMIKALGLLADHNYYSAYRINDYNKALSYYQALDSLITSESDSYFAADNTLGKANVYGMLKDVELEQYYFEEAKQLAIQDSLYGILFLSLIHI